MQPTPKQKLWEGLKKEGLYTKDFSAFEEQFSTDEKIEKLYQGVTSKGLYTKSPQEFKEQFFFTPTDQGASNTGGAQTSGTSSTTSQDGTVKDTEQENFVELASQNPEAKPLDGAVGLAIAKDPKEFWEQALKETNNSEDPVGYWETIVKNAGNLTKQIPASVAAAAAALTPDNALSVTPGGGTVQGIDPEREKEIVIVGKQGLIKIAQEQLKDVDTKGLVDTVDEINSIDDFAKFAIGAMTQTAGQALAATATGGASMYAQGIGDVYLDALEERAKETGKTVDEIIKDGDEQERIAASLGGVAIGMLEKIGLDKIMGKGASKQLKKTLLTRVKDIFSSMMVEGFTEGAQEIVGKIASDQGAGKSFDKTTKELLSKEFDKQLQTAIATGLVGGGGFSSVRVGAEVVGNLLSKPNATKNDAETKDGDGSEGQQIDDVQTDSDVQQSGDGPAQTIETEDGRQDKVDVGQEQELEQSKPQSKTKEEVQTELELKEKQQELDTRTKKANDLAAKVRDYNQGNVDKKDRARVKNEIRNAANELGYDYTEGPDKFVFKNLKERNEPQNLPTYESEDNRTFDELDNDVKERTSKLLDILELGIGNTHLGNLPDFPGNQRSTKGIINDIRQGKRTNRAESFLQALEEYHKQDGTGVSDGSGFNQAKQFAGDDYFTELHKETVGDTDWMLDNDPETLEKEFEQYISEKQIDEEGTKRFREAYEAETEGFAGQDGGTAQEITGNKQTQDRAGQGTDDNTGITRDAKVEASEIGSGKKRKRPLVERLKLDDRTKEKLGKKYEGNELEYDQQSVKKANQAADVFIGDTNDSNNLYEAYQVIKDDKEGRVPALVKSLVFGKTVANLIKRGATKKAKEVFEYQEKIARESGRFNVGLRADASPENLVSSKIIGLQQKKSKQLEVTDKEGITYQKRIIELENKLRELEKQKRPVTKAKVKKDPGYKEKAKQKREDALNRLSNAIQKKFTKQASPMDDTDVFKAAVDLFDSYLIQFSGDVKKAINAVVRAITKDGKITRKEVMNRYTDIIGESNEISDQERNDIIAEVQRQELEKFYQKTPKKTARRKRRTEIDKIIEGISKGTLESDAFSDMFADEFGFKAISQETKSKLYELTEKMSQYDREGKQELYNRTLREFTDFVQDNKAIRDESTQDVVLDIWYTSVLSSWSTTSRAIKGAGLTSSLDMFAKLIASPMTLGGVFKGFGKGFSRALPSYAQILKDGYSELDYIDQRPPGTGFIGRMVNKSFKEHIEKGDNAKALGKIVFQLPAMMYRNLIAMDAMLKYGLNEANSYIYEYNRILEQDGRANIYNKIHKSLALDREAEAKQQADEEVAEMKANNERIPGGYRNRRVQEIINEKRDQELVKKAAFESNKALLMNDPVGKLGQVYRLLSSIGVAPKDGSSRDKAFSYIFRGLFPFLRVPTNFINEAANYTPLGIIRGRDGTIRTRNGREELSRLDRQTLFAKSAIGAVTTVLFTMSLFDWEYDEEKGPIANLKKDALIDVTANGTGRFSNNYQIEKGYKTYSFRVRNSPDEEWSDYYSYVDNPIGMVLAPFGMLMDEIKIRDFRKKIGKRDYDIEPKNYIHLLRTGAMASMDFATSQSYSQGLKQLSTIAGGVFTGNTTGQTRALQDMITRPVGGLLMPNLYKEIYKQYKALREVPEKDARKWYEKPVKNMPFVEGLIDNNRYDVFGYPIVRDFNVPLVPDVILKMAKDNLVARENTPEWNLIWKYDGVYVGSFGKLRKVGDRRATEEDNSLYQRAAGERFKDIVNAKYDYLDTLGEEELQKELSKLKSQSSRYAKNTLNF
ncbi:MAG: hypothetical protein F6K19_01370 [Cyanothece sp. SIO1E1]|nr:hypothetical protein [Cyanothece sp. SIO1E1]